MKQAFSVLFAGKSRQIMKIKDIDLASTPYSLAPMEDVTDPAFRLMCKGFGADMVYTEFVSSDALIRSVSKTEQKLNISDKSARTPYRYTAKIRTLW